MESIILLTLLTIPTLYYDNNNTVVYNLKLLVLATKKFRKDDLYIPNASIDRRASVYVKNGCHLRLVDSVDMVFGFEPETTVNSSLVTNPYL